MHANTTYRSNFIRIYIYQMKLGRRYIVENRCIIDYNYSFKSEISICWIFILNFMVLTKQSFHRRLKSRRNLDPSYYFCVIKFYIKRLLQYPVSNVLWKIILLSCISFLRMQIVMQYTHFNNLSFVISMRRSVNAKEQFGIFILRF